MPPWPSVTIWGFQQFAGRGLRLCGRIPEVLAGPDRLAIGRLQVPSSRPLDRLAPARAVPAVAADCQQHPPAGVDPTGGDPELGHLGDGGQFAAPQRRLAGDLRPSAGVGRGLRRPQAVRRHPVRGRKLEVGRAHPRVLAQQRPLHRAPRPPQEDVRLSPPARGPKKRLRARQPVASAGSHSARIRSLRRRSRCRRCCKSSPPSRITADPRAASSSCRPCWRSGNWRVCPATAASTPLGAMPAL